MGILLVQITLGSDFPNHIFTHCFLYASTQRWLHVLSRHWNYFTSCFRNKSISAFTTLRQNGILSKTVHLFQLYILLFDDNDSFLYDIERISVISLRENDLIFLISLSETSRGYGILLFFSQLLKKGENTKELFILFLGVSIKFLHNLFKDIPIHLNQIAIHKRKHTSWSRRTINNSQIAKWISKSKYSFLLVVNFHLTTSLQYDVIWGNLVALLEDVFTF